MAHRAAWVVFLCVLGVIATLLTVVMVPDGPGRFDDGTKLLATIAATLVWIAFGLLWWPYRNAHRVETLRRSHPDAIVFGAQAAPGLDSQLASTFPLDGDDESSFGQLVTVLADQDGLSFWKGPGGLPERRAFIPWTAVTAVSKGRVHYARPLASVQLQLREGLGAVAVDVVPVREGPLGGWAVISPTKIADYAAKVEARRSGHPSAG